MSDHRTPDVYLLSSPCVVSKPSNAQPVPSYRLLPRNEGIEFSAATARSKDKKPTFRLPAFEKVNELFDALQASTVRELLSGESVCLLLVGGSGCGKSYAAEGTKDRSEPGLARRLIMEIARQQPTAEFCVEDIRYAMPRTSDRRPGEASDGVIKSPNTQAWCTFEEALRVYAKGTKIRSAASEKTSSNATSSRDQRHVAIKIRNGQSIATLHIIDIPGKEKLITGAQAGGQDTSQWVNHNYITLTKAFVLNRDRDLPTSEDQIQQKLGVTKDQLKSLEGVKAIMRVLMRRPALVVVGCLRRMSYPSEKKQSRCRDLATADFLNQVKSIRLDDRAQNSRVSLLTLAQFISLPPDDVAEQLHFGPSNQFLEQVRQAMDEVKQERDDALAALETATTEKRDMLAKQDEMRLAFERLRSDHEDLCDQYELAVSERDEARANHAPFAVRHVEGEDQPPLPEVQPSDMVEPDLVGSDKSTSPIVSLLALPLLMNESVLGDDGTFAEWDDHCRDSSTQLALEASGRMDNSRISSDSSRTLVSRLSLTTTPLRAGTLDKATSAKGRAMAALMKFCRSELSWSEPWSEADSLLQRPLDAVEHDGQWDILAAWVEDAKSRKDEERLKIQRMMTASGFYPARVAV